MAPPSNSIYIVQGEMNIVVAAMKKGVKWSSHTYQEVEDSLTKNFTELKKILIKCSDLKDMDPNDFLDPFLKVIRSGDTSGPVTGLALSSVNKFLSYGLIDVEEKSAAAAVENITDAVTHARFVGTDPGSDEVVLMKILQVLKTLLLTPAGILLSNDSICEIMQSCFRICFEMRLSELLRKSAESSLVDMAQLLFVRLPHFKDDNSVGSGLHKLKMRPSAGMDNSRGISKKKLSRSKVKKPAPTLNPPSTEDRSELTLELAVEAIHSTENNAVPTHNATTPATTPSESGSKSLDGTLDDSSTADNDINETATGGVVDMQENLQANVTKEVDLSTSLPSPEKEAQPQVMTKSQEDDYVNPRGVRFVPPPTGKEGPLVPYGLPCVRELFRFLVSLINPLDKQNSEVMIHIGLNLITVALETNATCLGSFPSLLGLVKDELCRYVFELINSDRITLFSVALRVCFLLFESLRPHLKFQLEMYLNKLTGIITSESPKIVYEQREAVLDAIVQLWRIPGFVTELYLNYDCDLYCTNVFEELTKILSKNAFPISGIYTAHLLSLSALLTVIESIKTHCQHKVLDTTCNFTISSSQSNESTREIFLNSRDILNHQQAASGYLYGVGFADKHLSKSAADEWILESEKTFPVTSNIPSHGDLVKIKHKKSLLITGAEQFNLKPVKGIQFLQENGILNPEFDPVEISAFLKENSRLDKKMIGEFISNRKNLKVLEAFVKSFNFDDTRIDEALRMYLETFRLPGEAPVISLLLEHFAEHWHKMNNEPFVNSDAAFTLAYAVIMLNVDQHNHNVKKQSIPMTLEEFKKNLTKVNGGKDFDADVLEDIYSSIKSEEIVMPAEHTGLVKENYLWKMLIRKGMTKDGSFIRANDGEFDRELFTLTWGPIVAALSFVFDKSLEKDIVETTINGFRMCAMIAAHFGMCDVFDHLIISICKFTTLLSSTESPETLPVSFGHNAKAQLAAATVFDLAHQHGDILREGWKNILDCLQQLYYAKLLPTCMVEAEDFVNPNGKTSLIREEIPIQRSETGLFSSFYSYITLTADSQVQKGLSQEDQDSAVRAQKCILKCHPERLVTESKFLRADSLQELVKALIYASPGPDSHASSQSGTYDEYTTIFFLELLVEIVLHNRDRVNVVWQGVRDHIYSLMMGSSATEYYLLMERTVVSILRLAVRLLWREDMTAQVLQSLKMLLLLKPPTSLKVARQIAFALHELLKSNAANIHTSLDWTTLFTLLEYFGAGAKPTKLVDDLLQDAADSASENGVQSDSDLVTENVNQNEMRIFDRGYTSDSELYEAGKSHQKTDFGSNISSSNTNLDNVGKKTSENIDQITVNQYEIVLKREFTSHDTVAFLKCCESLAFLIRDVAHITPANLESCIYSLRTFVEASLNGGKHHLERRSVKYNDNKERKFTHRLSGRRKEEVGKVKRSVSSNQVSHLTEDSDSQSLDGGYLQASIQLLDLMHTLHTRACPIVTSWANEETTENKSESEEPRLSDVGYLWSKYWCPLLQGIARLCCDSRRQVRTAAVTYLQRALLVHDLQTLSALEWETCFNRVLFPLLLKLLENVSPNDPSGLEETRMRGATLLCKVFLQHLTPLLSLSTFTALFLTILDFMDKYMHADKSDLLCEAIPESLKNMLLVMDTAGIFSTVSGHSQLWVITWDRIDSFLPGLKEEVFRSHQRADVKVPELENVSSEVTGESAPQQTEISESPTQSSSCVVEMNDPDETIISDSTGSELNISTSPSKDIRCLDTHMQSVTPVPTKGTSTLIDQGQHLQSQLPISVLRVQDQGLCAMPNRSIPLVINREIFNGSTPITVINQTSAIDQGSPT